MKRILRVLFSLTVLLFMSIGVLAEDNVYVIDNQGFVSSDELEALNNQADDIYEDFGFYPMIVVDYSYDSSNQLATDTFTEHSQSDDGIVFALTKEEWSIVPFGSATPYFDTDTCNKIFEVISKEKSTAVSFSQFIRIATNIYRNQGIQGLDIEAKETPSSYRYPRLVDEASLLTYDEQKALTAKLDELSEKYACDIVVVTTNSIGDKYIVDYVDDFYDYHGYSDDGVVLLISMEERDWAISTKGFGINAFNDSVQNRIMQEVRPHLSEGKFYDAFDAFADSCDSRLDEFINGNPKPQRKAFDFFSLPLSLGFGALFGFGTASREKSKLKSVRQKYAASSYIVPGSLKLYNLWDRYNYTHRTVTPVPTRTESNDRDHDSGSSGSSVHISSSGSFHGGSHGKF